MTFKENLLKKIKLDQMKARVLGTLGPVDRGRKMDKQAMSFLLEEGGFRHKKVRHLDLYLPEGAGEEGKSKILVFDKELAIYDTTVDDVALRKEPTLKEMISIRNAIKILDDSDVVVSKKEKSVETVYHECMSRLDLSFESSDIKELEYEGRAAVEWKDATALLENLSLFEELLQYRLEPKAFQIENYHIRGVHGANERGEEVFGPAVIYGIADHSIKLLKERINVREREGINYFYEVAVGRRSASLEGTAVIKFLAEEVLLKACGKK